MVEALKALSYDAGPDLNEKLLYQPRLQGALALKGLLNSRGNS